MQDDDSVTVTLTKQHLIWLNQAILELPGKFAIPLLQELNRQIAAQRKTATPDQIEQAPTLQ